VNQVQRKPAAHRQIQLATQAFIHGICFVRSFTHPYIAQRVGPLWVARDAPRKRDDYRCEEWVALDVPPQEVHRLVQKHAQSRITLCVMHPVKEPDDQLRANYKTLGYRLLVTEPLMMHSLKRIPRFDPPQKVKIERVTTQEIADRLAKVARARQILPEHLKNDRPLRQYIALSDEKIVGWVRSVAAGASRWCSNMHVLPAYRRRGIARAMLSRMLRDDRAAGAQANVLTASHTGALLYPLLGYQHLATLYAYKPRRK